jgi:hypothetical protein
MSATNSEITRSIALSDNIIDIIMPKLSYPTIYNLYLKGNAIYHNYLLKQGQKIITILEEWIHPAAGYTPISADFEFTNLDKIIKHIWNMIICLSSNLPANILYDACNFITMECDVPESYDVMIDDMWDFIIVRYLDSEYDVTTNSWLGGYKRWKYICNAIDEYSETHLLDTPAKQKYALVILIMKYIEHKDEIMHMYEDELEQIDTDEKYYNVLQSMIMVVSGNRHLCTEMIPQQFIIDTFYFMS